ncbi:hypothetical protein [Paenirhodobacter populi]|uniref:hypothetical protein n=1 Tax=Paenirhodobacter populi TaxID=2306993 RepID=UPI000FE430E9|nr:hypothetical protein [Sinirhodobacter populi]RWR04021.1 hypothetical protein D2T32_21005 [Sinirhodobacter populi]
MSEQNTRHEVIEQIVQAAEKHFVSGQPYLLSKLGADLGEAVRVIKGSNERTLANFIRVNLADNFEVILTGKHGNVQAVIPKGADFQYSSESPTVANPRFHSRFWAAFAVPSSEKKRWFSIDNMTFVDSEESPGEGFIEIESCFIAQETQSDRDDFIKESIKSWLSKHKIDQDKVIASGKRPHPSQTANSGRSLLEYIIDSLDARQLSNTKMSLDVIATLLGKRR